jgi:hypothetical protein
MGRLRCLLGRHAWEHGRNPEIGGADADYELCVGCGKERPKYGHAPPSGATVR